MIKIILLLMLLAVLAWKVNSCQGEVDAKRQAAARATAAFEARTSEAPSRLPLDPYQRKAAMAEKVRLRPDARFLIAAGHLAGKPVTAVPSAEGWELRAGGASLGSLPDLASFAELMKALRALAGQRPVPAGEAPPEEPLLLWEPEARARLPEALLQAGSSVAALHAAARTATSLAFYEMDFLQTDDELPGRALALVALDKAAGKAGTASEEALLAAALGYQGESRELAAGGDPLLRHFLTGDAEKLRADATGPGATSVSRYLWARHLVIQERDDDEAFRFLSGPGRDDLFELATVALVTETRRMESFARPAFSLPAFILAAAANVPVSRQDGAALRALRHAAVVLGTHGLPSLLEAALRRQSPEVAGYLRALWFSALARQGEYIVDGQNDRELASEFSETLASVDSPTVKTFRGYFDLRAKLLSGDPLPALAATGALPVIGGAPLARLVERAGEHAHFAEPRAIRAARDLAPRLDARVEDRRVLGAMAWSALEDLRTSFRMTSSAIAAAPQRDAGSRVWLAGLSHDEAALQRLADDRSLRMETRLSAVERLAEPAKKEQGMRSLLAEAPGDFDVFYALTKQLRAEGRMKESVGMLLDWLRPNDGPTLQAGYVRGSLARDAYLEGRYADGLEYAKPAVAKVYNSSALVGAALNLAGLQRKTEAREVTGKLLARYGGVDSFVCAAEVEWVLGDLPAAAARLLNSRLRPTDYREDLGPAFVRLFGDQPARAAEAARALAAAGIDPPLVDELAVALDHAAKYDAAVRLHEALPGGPAAATMFRMRAAGSIQKWKGRDAAVEYLRKRLPVKNDNEGRRLLMMGWREEKQLVWDLVPDPAGTGDDAEQIWLMRAAALARAGKDAPPARLEAAKAHYAGLKDKSRHPQLGRYLLGEVSEADAAKLVTNISASCEVPFYFGVKAEGEERLADAADWYAVALECGVRTEAEYLYAYDALYQLRGRGAPFERFR